MTFSVSQGALAWPSLVGAAVVGGTALYAVAEVRGAVAQRNVWDIAVPALANVQLFPLLVAVLWLPSLAHQHGELLRGEVLIRHGSWQRVVGRQILHDLGQASGVVVLCLVVVLAVSSPLGFSADWSAYAMNVLHHGGIDTYTSASAAATVLAKPWVFLVIQAGWAVVGLLGYSVVHLVALLSWGRRAANAVLLLAGLHGVLVSSGVFGSRPFMDTSAGLNFLWAATEPMAIGRTVFFWAAVASLLFLVVQWRDGAQNLRPTSSLLALSAVAFTVGVLLIFGLSAGEGQAEGVDPLDVALAGQNSSLTGFVIAALPMLTVATIVVLRAAEDVTAGLEPVLSRHGTSWRWVWGYVGLLCAASYSVAVIVVLGLTVLGMRSVETAAQVGGIRDVEGILITTATYGGLAILVGGAGLVLVWWRGDGDFLPFLLLAVPTLGYPFFGDGTPLNPLSAFSREEGFSPAIGPLFAQAVFIVFIFLGLAVVTHRRRVPGNL